MKDREIGKFSFFIPVKGHPFEEGVTYMSPMKISHFGVAREHSRTIFQIARNNSEDIRTFFGRIESLLDLSRIISNF
jgi:hypothetical protein